jgi:peptidoglycan hydrolase-like protein with peptidoglycan-binding domain
VDGTITSLGVTNSHYGSTVRKVTVNVDHAAISLVTADAVHASPEERMNSGPRLAVGALGRDVQRAQTIFVMMKSLGFEQIDGVFGAVTRNTVIAFQQGEGLVADGVIGDDTWKRMPIPRSCAAARLAVR